MLPMNTINASPFLPTTDKLLDTLPDPVLISRAALKDAGIHYATGILAAYDEATQTGGLINVHAENPSWNLKKPIERKNFLEGFINLVQPRTPTNNHSEQHVH